MNLAYTDNTLQIVDNDTVILSQPCWPDGTPWADETEALAWAAAHIAWLDDETGNTPEAPTGPA